MGISFLLLFLQGSKTTEPFALFALLGQEGVGREERGGGCCNSPWHVLWSVAGWTLASSEEQLLLTVLVLCFPRAGGIWSPPHRGWWERCREMKGKEKMLPYAWEQNLPLVLVPFASWLRCLSCRKWSMKLAQFLSSAVLSVKENSRANPSGKHSLASTLVLRHWEWTSFSWFWVWICMVDCGGKKKNTLLLCSPLLSIQVWGMAFMVRRLTLDLSRKGSRDLHNSLHWW